MVHTYLTVDLSRGAAVYTFPTPLGSGDYDGNIIVLQCVRGGEKADLSGCGAAVYINRSDKTTVRADGSIDGSSVIITLPLEAYAVTGEVTMAVKVGVSGSSLATVCWLHGTVGRTAFSTIIEPDGSTGDTVVTVTGAVRYDIAQSLTDDQKAQARANIGVTSTGADISGIIDDDINSYETVWSSNKVIEMLVSIDSRGDVGTLSDLTTTIKTDLVSAINEVNAKADSGSGGSTTVTTSAALEQGWLTSSGTESTSDQHCRTAEYIPKAGAALTMPASIAAKILLYNYADGVYEYQTVIQLTEGHAYTQESIEGIATLPGVTYTHVRLLFARGSVDTPTGTITPAELTAEGVSVTMSQVVTLAEIYQRLIDVEAKLAAM